MTAVEQVLGRRRILEPSYRFMKPWSFKLEQLPLTLILPQSSRLLENFRVILLSIRNDAYRLFLRAQASSRAEISISEIMKL